jgi:hypothetical protein
MNKKPNFSTSKESRLFEAKKELQQESDNATISSKIISTTLSIESSLLYAVKEIALKRKISGIKPNTVTGIIKESLKEIVKKENINI